ncbi:MAG: hypothetical protein ACLPOO_08460 [Terriglobales bacterium]
MSRLHLATILVLLCFGILLLTGFGGNRVFWSQWGRNPQHEGMVSSFGQPLNHKLADIVYDPFVPQEKLENFPIYGEGALTAHYQSTLVDDDNSFYMVQKTGTYPLCSPLYEWIFGGNCGPNAWNQLSWNVVRYDWKQGQAAPAWSYWTDWTPVPNATALTPEFTGYVGLYGWEPVFHPALVGQHLYVPGAGGTVWKVDKQTGQMESHINPFAGMNINPTNTYISGPLTADENGNIFYNVIELNTNGNPWQQNDVAGAWLAKVAPDDTSASVTFAVLIPNAPPGNSDDCPGTFLSQGYYGAASLPWPPANIPFPPTYYCGSQRPPINVAPAIGPDGTVYTVSVAHFNQMVTYLVAANPDLTPKWAASMQHRLTDGCGVLLPIAPPNVTDLPNSCRYGTTVGVDPTTGENGSATISDTASASPTVLPDGSVLFGTLDNYNHGQGHLMHFDARGNYINAFTFGWDSTAAVYRHDGTYSIVIKDNHYGGAAYCEFDSPVCTGPPPLYLISQLDANLNVEWSFENTTIDSDHPYGYEWCVNEPVVDGLGVVYANSEDGNVYSIPQGHHGIFKTPRQKIFLQKAIEAAYTPLSIGADGKEYTQNNGHLFVIGW